MADIKISELTAVSSLNNGDLVEVSQVNELAPSGYTSLKASMADIGKKVNTDIEYTTDLADFTNKTTLGAIKETANLIPKTDNNLPHYTGTPTAGSTAEAIGDLTQLTTTADDLVGAVNEVNGKTTSTNTTVGIGTYGDDIQLCKSGKVVVMIINPLSSLPSGGWTQIGTLPSGYEPIIQIISDMYSRDDRHLRIRLDTDRKIYVYNYSTVISSSNNAYWNITYITA